MPVLSEGSRSGAVQVAPSAVLELMWVLHNAEADHQLTGAYEIQEGLRQKFGPQLKAFWADGVRGYTDTVVLAQRTQTLLDMDLDAFFERLDEGAARGEVPSLLSESPADRRALGDRLERLRTDKVLRARYGALLREVWEAVREGWEATGRPIVTAEAARWARRAREGAGYHEILDRAALWSGRPDIDRMADAAAAEGKLVLSPGWYYGLIHVVELDGAVYVGRGVLPKEETAYREVASQVAASIKALADPTRLAILLWLARQPASVTEVARHFMLAQPTVSGHVQLLREAGLIDEKQSGRSSRLSANEAGLRRLFSDAEESLVRLFRATD